MATPNYEIDYNDSRFTEVEADKKAALNEVDVTYGNMIGQTDQFYQAQIQAAKDYADKQTKIQNEKTDFAIEQIEQQKEQTKKDYVKEQSGAYVDWQKQSGQYGVTAEQQAAQGMRNTGYSESSQVSMWNTYQNRVATAREAYTRAVLNYDNAIKDARLQNNAALAEIAYNALQKQLELSLAGFQYKNELIIAQSDKKLAVDSEYYGRYQDVLAQINTENALAEDVRQFNAQMSLEQAKFNYQKAQDAAEAAKIDKGGSGGGGGGGGGGDSNTKSHSSYVQAGQKAKMDSTAYVMEKIDGMIANGATKDQISNVISQGLRDGAITKAEATRLRNAYIPRGVQY